MPCVTENSIKIQVGVLVVVFAAMLVLRPEPVWWGLVLLASSGVLTAELFNTAVEHLADHLHPEVAPEYPDGEGLRCRSRTGGGAGGDCRGDRELEPISDQKIANCRLSSRLIVDIESPAPEHRRAPSIWNR